MRVMWVRGLVCLVLEGVTRFSRAAMASGGGNVGLRVGRLVTPGSRYEVQRGQGSNQSTKEWGSILDTEGKSAVPRLPLLGASASTGMLVGKVMPEKYSDADNGKGGRGWF